MGNREETLEHALDDIVLIGPHSDSWVQAATDQLEKPRFEPHPDSPRGPFTVQRIGRA